jgi:iron(III) transport system ATP-binding protein
MSAIVVKGLVVDYGGSPVLRDLDLSVPDGSVTAVLGPSGCGKTSLLRAVGGLLRPASGFISLRGRVVDDEGTWVRPEHRRVGIVPQEGALFPHLDVLGNVSFALDGSRRDKAKRTAELLELVGMAGTESLRPQELSGGMQQRVAVARALSRRPDVVLLDEPFSALDAGLRDGVRADVLAAIRADGAAALLVTHDQDEALSSADRVAVMRDGVIVQEGTPTEVYGAPVDLGVARFVGACVELPVTVTGDGVLRTALGDLPDSAPVADPAAATAVGISYVAVLRPEQLRFTPGPPSGPSADGDRTGVAARVTAVRYHGHDCLLDVTLDDGTSVPVRLLGSTHAQVGEPGTITATAPPLLLPV